VLAFTNVYFLESGLFNGLRAIGIKNFSLRLKLRGHRQDTFHSLSSIPNAAVKSGE
jgi:hypothetical protein